MTALQPTAKLQIAIDQDVFGIVTYRGDSMTWPLAGLLSEGRPGNTFSGLVTDPSGQYLMQAPVLVFDDTDETQWTLGGSTNYTHGTGAADVAGKKSLVWKGGTGAFSPTHNYTRADEEGLAGRFWIGTASAPASATNFYIQFSTSYRLALEPGLPIRLQSSADGGTTWADMAGGVASALGECETYLSSVGRVLYVDVLAETDPAWFTGLPGSAADSGQPPNVLCVSLNGNDAVLTVPISTWPGGQLKITGVNRHWSVTLARKRFAITCAADLETQAHVVDLQGDAETTARGYVPPDSGLTFTVTVGAANQAAAALNINVTGDGLDDTGYAIRTVFLAALVAEWPQIETAPLESPSYTEYDPCSLDVDFWYDQATSTARASGTITFVDSNYEFAPGAGGLLPAVRAFALYLGYEGQTLTKVMTGYTGKRASDAFRWFYRNGLRYVTVSLDDRLIMADQTACEYQPPYDATNHYWAMGRLAARVGFVSSDRNFPDCTKYQDGYYQLKYGTARQPALQPQPNDVIMQAMQMIRGDAGDIDGTTGQIQPMVLGTDADGKLDYFPMAVGVAQALATPGFDSGLVAQQVFRVAPGFDGVGNPLLNELYGIETTASLSQIRSSAVFEGRDVNTGEIVISWAYDSDVITDPNTPGYIGCVPSAYIQISRKNTSLDVVERQAQLAAVQLRYPSVRTRPQGPLQPALFILTLFEVQEAFTQGTTGTVPYYATHVHHHYSLEEAAQGVIIHAGTTVVGQLLGQAGE